MDAEGATGPMGEQQSVDQECQSTQTDVRQRRSSRKRAAGAGESSERSINRPRVEQQTSEQQQQQQESDVPELSLQVKWTSVSGRTKVTQLPLSSMPRWDCTSGLHKRLVARVFSESERERPPSLTCAEYLQFNTAEECLNYPLDIARTSFRLVASHEGWQYVIHESPMDPPTSPPDFLHVVSIEFETVARVIGHLGIRMSMVAYPIVAIHKVKLMDAVERMRTDPNFKGIL